MIKINNVNIVNPKSQISNADIWIDKNKITKIVRKPGVPSQIAIPGFIDPHIHGFFNSDCMDGKLAVEKMSLGLKDEGVTSFFPTLMTSQWNELIQAASMIAQAETRGAKILGMHAEGPFISNEKKGAQNPKYIIQASKQKIQELYNYSQKKLSRITFAPECNDLELITWMKKELQIEVLVGHSKASSQITYQAANYGATGTTHLWNGMSGVLNRSPGIVQAALQDDRFFTELICDFVHVDPETIKFTIKNKTADRVVVVSDAIKPAGLKDGEYISGGLKVIKKGNLVKTVYNNSIAGGASSIKVGFYNLLSMGYILQDVVKMTSYNVALQHNLQKVAEIKKGYFADIIMLDMNKKIQKVFVNGVL